MERSVAIWWIRRDLRMHDNPALHAALQNAQQVIPLFISDSNLIHSPSTASQRMAFLWEGLRSLDEELKRKSSRLILRTGKPYEILLSMLAETGARKICAQRDYSP